MVETSQQLQMKTPKSLSVVITKQHLDTIAIGRETKASGSGATVIGARAEASGNNAIAIGQSGEGSPKVIASGVNSIAIGMQSQATGESAIAEGPGPCRR